jgi:hypothetical protein
VFRSLLDYFFSPAQRWLVPRRPIRLVGRDTGDAA